MTQFSELFFTLKAADMESGCEKLLSALKELSQATDSIIADVNTEIIRHTTTQNYQRIATLAAIPAQVEQCKTMISELLEQIDPKPVTVEYTESGSKKNPVTLEKHLLNETASFTRPYYFEVAGKRYDLKKRTWVCFGETICDILYAIDPEKIKIFMDKVQSEGLSYCVFSKTPQPEFHKIAESDLYVRIRGDANSVKAYAQRLLAMFGLEEQVDVYWAVIKQKDDNEDAIHVGDQVEHDTFGIGTVLSLSHDKGIITANVRFGDDVVTPIVLDGQKTRKYLTKQTATQED